MKTQTQTIQGKVITEITQITKKEIREKTITTRGSGFNPKYKHVCHLGHMNQYEKPFNYHIVTREGNGNQPIIGYASNKKEFIDAIYHYINDGS